MFIGHKFAVAALCKGLPRCALLIGPDSVGKRTLSLELAKFHKIVDADLCEIEKLRMPDARALGEWSRQMPIRSAQRLAVVDLDGSSVQALNAMLKTLEEAPESFRAILRATAGYKLLDTVVSRCEVFHLGYLQELEVHDVLIAKGMSSTEAMKLSWKSGGQMSVALGGHNQDYAKTIAVNVVKAFANGDKNLFDHAIEDVNEDVLKWMRVWSLEVNTGKWKHFKADQRFGMKQRELSLIMIKLQKDVRVKLLLKSMWDDLIVRT